MATHIARDAGKAELAPKFIAESNFMTVYSEVIQKYKGIVQKPKTPAAVGNMLNDLSFGRHDLPYYKLRALAEFVKLPAGLFLLFTHCASLERDAKEKQSNQDGMIDPKFACMDLIEGLGRVVDAMTRHIAESQPGGDVFMKHYGPDPDSYLPNMEILKAWADAYQNKNV